jgi:SH3 domain-binding protein 5 (SH3BP5)
MFQHAKAKFRQVKTDSSHRLSALSRQIGKKWVIKARPYYDLLRQSQKVRCMYIVVFAVFQNIIMPTVFILHSKIQIDSLTSWCC